MKRYAILMSAVLLCSCGERRDDAPAYTGRSDHWNQERVPISLQCAACHPKEFAEWSGSDHAWAWREPNTAEDSEPFHGQMVHAHGEKLKFHTDAAGKPLLTDADTGEQYRVHSVLGRRPLVQYLVESHDGGLHTPSAAWDTENHEWFDMFEADARLTREGNATRSRGDWGHWLGRGMNWNSQCAWCHMSGFRKDYNEATDTYHSTHTEPGVTCIQCHTPSEKPATDGCMVSPGERKLSARQVHDNCASCHARREEMDDTFRAGDRFDDHFRLELPLIEGVFYPNGMQRDEVYCETGLKLSRMGNAGVTCTDCHNPHTGGLILPQEDNSLCMRCHRDGTVVGETAAPIISPKEHTPCPEDSTGDRCVECHMPESPYMARDPRRDHSFNSPDPQLSEEIGIPNACLNCHKESDNAVTEQQVNTCYPDGKRKETRRRTRAVAAALQGVGDAEELLAVLKTEPNPMWRATLLMHLAALPSDEATESAARQSAASECAAERAAAAYLSSSVGKTLLKDPSKSVRRAAAWGNLPSLTEQAPEAMEEQLATARHQADQPTGAMQAAMLAQAAGNPAEAEKQYRRAIALDPSSHVAYMDFAVFLDAADRPAEALEQMLRCAKAAPQNAEVQYRLGCILAQLGYRSEAIRALRKALDIDSQHTKAQQLMRSLLPYIPNSAQ